MSDNAQPTPDQLEESVAAPKLKTFEYASPSQVKTFRDCPRKWWYEKILGLPTPTSAAQAFGTKVHDQVENYINGKLKVSEMMPEAVELLQYIPDPSRHKLIAEPKLDMPKGDGWPVNITGRVDLVAQDQEGPHIVRIIDWKTTKNFAYVPEHEDLKSDPQRLMYTAMLLHHEPKATHVSFRL